MHTIVKSPTVITIGTFDGVHLGHQNILKRVSKLAKRYKKTPIVLTLFPHPRMVLQKDNSIQLLNTIEERISLLKSYGITEVIVKKFTKDFANLSAEAYVKDILVNELQATHIVIGYDHHFGKNRSANINDLRQFAKRYNFEVEEISAKDVNDITVSSTKIRQALHNGDVHQANSFLGYNYFISGKVIKGKGLGRTIDFPTANIKIDADYKLIPKDGVYVVKSKIDNQWVYGMMNIGYNPTVEGKTKSIEVYFFDFNTSIYNTKLCIEFLIRLRDEKKFDNIQALKTQLKLDKQNALAHINA